MGWVASDGREAVEYLRELVERQDELNEIRGNIRNVKETGGALKIARLIKDMVGG